MNKKWGLLKIHSQYHKWMKNIEETIWKKNTFTTTTIEIIAGSQIRNDETNLESNSITDELNKERNKQQWHENESIEFVNEWEFNHSYCKIWKFIVNFKII